MTRRIHFASLTRISDLALRPFETTELPREQWATGDYVLVHVDEHPRGFRAVELSTGRMAEVGRDALVLGAFGAREATLEAVGTWEAIGPDGRLQLLTAAGLLGRVTSLSTALPSLLAARYAGHVVRDGRKVAMTDFVTEAPDVDYRVPTLLLVGTSMSAGKTTTAKVVIGHLKRAGLHVVGAKLSGAGRYRDILGMSDAGADQVFDFVDVGLPSTIVPEEEMRTALRRLLSRIAGALPDVVVAEAGASPLEPYHGEVVLQELGDHVRAVILCASDPYAVVGVMRGYQAEPDLVAGLATSTSAGVRLVERLSGVQALNVLDPAAQEPLARFLERVLGAR